MPEETDIRTETGCDDGLSDAEEFEKNRPLVMALSVFFILIGLVLLAIIVISTLVQFGVIDEYMLPW